MPSTSKTPNYTLKDQLRALGSDRARAELLHSKLKSVRAAFDANKLSLLEFNMQKKPLTEAALSLLQSYPEGTRLDQIATGTAKRVKDELPSLAPRREAGAQNGTTEDPSFTAFRRATGIGIPYPRHFQPV